MLESMGRLMVLLGAGSVVVGLALILVSRLTGGEGLPGDLVIRRPNLTVFVPLGTMILLSVILTLIVNLVLRLRPPGGGALR